MGHDHNDEGTALVVLPDAFVTEGLAGALADVAGTAAAHVLHHPGRHASEPLDFDWDGMDDLIYSHLATLRAQRSGPRVFVGAGIGGWIGMEIALRAPELVERLLLVAPYGVRFGDPTQPNFADILLLDTDEVSALGWARPERARGLHLPGLPEDLDDAALEDVFTERATLAQLAWKPFLHNPTLGRWLHTIDVPVLLVRGAEDGLVTSANSAEIVRRLPDARLVEIPDAGHYPYLEQPAAFIQAVLPFINHREEEAVTR